jgi:hypothetical protein
MYMQVLSIAKLKHKIDAKTISTVTFDFTNSFSSLIFLLNRLMVELMPDHHRQPLVCYAAVYIPNSNPLPLLS